MSRSITAALVGALGCVPAQDESPPRPIPVSDLRAGLSFTGGAMGTDGHLVEMAVHEGYVYTANSNSGLTVMRLEQDGSLTSVFNEGDAARHRCTTLAIHEPSHTLYCGADAAYGALPHHLEVYDLSIPGHPVWRENAWLDQSDVRDLELAGERLLINQFAKGLWTATIDAQGQLSGLSKAPVAGNVRFTVALGDRLVSLLAEPDGSGSALLLLDAVSFAQLDRLELQGPPLGVSKDAGGDARVAVALGSGGMAIVELAGDTLSLERVLEPPAVVTWALLSGELAVAVTLTGAFAWTLDAAQPRMFGFGVSGTLGRARAGNMLHGLLHEGELLTSDWLYVERWSIDPSGDVLDLDVPRGIYMPPSGPLRWRMRNPGELTLRAELWRERERLWSAELGPGEVVEVELSAEQRAAILPPDEPSVPLVVRAYDPAVPSMGEPLSSTVLVLVQRWPDNPLPPAVGEVFPTVALEDLEHVPYTMPTAGGGQTIWYWPDCAMMWPELEDLAWLWRAGRDLGRGEPIFLTNYDVAVDGFPQRFSLEGVRFGMWGAAAPSLGDANDWLGEDIYMRFFIQELPGDAMPTDYVFDGQGVVRSIERMYRGPWTLVVPGPWE